MQIVKENYDAKKTVKKAAISFAITLAALAATVLSGMQVDPKYAAVTASAAAFLTAAVNFAKINWM